MMLWHRLRISPHRCSCHPLRLRLGNCLRSSLRTHPLPLAATTQTMAPFSPTLRQPPPPRQPHQYHIHLPKVQPRSYPRYNISNTSVLHQAPGTPTSTAWRATSIHSSLTIRLPRFQSAKGAKLRRTISLHVFILYTGSSTSKAHEGHEASGSSPKCFPLMTRYGHEIIDQGVLFLEPQGVQWNHEEEQACLPQRSL
jgi:hypothetical protein